MKTRMAVGRCCCGPSAPPPWFSDVCTHLSFTFESVLYGSLDPVITGSFVGPPWSNLYWSGNRSDLGVGMREGGIRRTIDGGVLEAVALGFHMTPFQRYAATRIVLDTEEPYRDFTRVENLTLIHGDRAPYTTTTVTGYYAFNTGSSIARSSLLGALTLPWTWSYGVSDFVIDATNLMIAAQNDPAYSLGSRVQLLWLPDTTVDYPSNSGTVADPAGPIPQEFTINSLTQASHLEYQL